MDRNHVLLLGLFLKLVFLIHSSEQFEDPLQQHILRNEDGNHELSALEFQKILFEYDKDGDGELSGQEMSKYIEDTLATLKPETGGRDSKEKLQKGSVGNRGSKQKSSKTAQTWSVKQIVGGLVVVFFVTAVCVALLQRRDQTPGQKVEVADVRAARLRKLAGEQSDTKTENSPPACVKETSALNRQPSIDSNKKGLRKRLENIEVTATNSGEAERVLSSIVIHQHPSAMEIQFGIHQDLWQDAWIAATSAVRAKKRQIDLNVQQRVQRLISDHSPGTGKALTLRVYGTMIKGFCVINNDRARVLHTDCERVVLLFAEQPYSEQGLKLPAAKRQRVDAVTLDLSRVKEAETFDWTQTPLGEDLLERLGPVERLPEPQEATGWAIGMMPAMPSLIEELPAFPEVPMAEVPAPEGAPPAAPEGAAAAPDADALDLFGGDLELPELPELPEAEKKRRRRLPPPGHVLGFDEKITAEVAEAQASVEPPGLESQAERLRERTEMFADHLGPLRILLGTSDRAVAYDALSAPPSESLPLPEVQPLLDDQIRPEMLGAIFARSPEGDAFLAAAAQAAEAATAAEAEAVGEDPAEAAEAAEAKAFDVQTAQIGAVIRHFVEEKDGPVMLDDLMPPSCTEKITAARTFGCLLGLATGGGLQVYQELPYGPISIALA